MFLVIKPCSLAIPALTFAQYVSAVISPFVDDTGLMVKAIGAASLCTDHIKPHIYMLSPSHHSSRLHFSPHCTYFHIAPL
jgi:hypothetical protein